MAATSFHDRQRAWRGDRCEVIVRVGAGHLRRFYRVVTSTWVEVPSDSGGPGFGGGFIRLHPEKVTSFGID